MVFPFFAINEMITVVYSHAYVHANITYTQHMHIYTHATHILTHIYTHNVHKVYLQTHKHEDTFHHHTSSITHGMTPKYCHAILCLRVLSRDVFANKFKDGKEEASG